MGRMSKTMFPIRNESQPAPYDHQDKMPISNSLMHEYPFLTRSHKPSFMVELAWIYTLVENISLKDYFFQQWRGKKCSKSCFHTGLKNFFRTNFKSYRGKN